MMRAFFLSKAVYDKKMKFLILILLLSCNLLAKSGRIYSLGAGVNSVSSSDSSIESIGDGSFVRLSHEGLLAKKLLYVVGAGYSQNDLKVNYEYEGTSSTTSLGDFDATSSRIEGRLGLKYNFFHWLYLGGGAIFGDFRLEYDRDDFIRESNVTDNFIKSENKNFFGSYGEVGLMHVYKNIGFRVGAEIAAVTMSDKLETLGDSKPNLSSQKFYIEILWKN